MWTVRGLEDFNGDGQRDLIWQNVNGSLAAWFMDGTNRIGSGYLRNGTPPTPAWRCRALSDFNGDNQADILWHHTDRRLAVWFMNQTNLTSSVLLRGGLSSAPGWNVIGVFDFDANGQNDILWQNSSGVMAVWFMNQTNFLGAALLMNGQPLNLKWQWAGPR